MMWKPAETCDTSAKVLIGVPAGGAIVGRLYRTTDGTPVRESFMGVGTVFEGFIYRDISVNRTLVACQYGARICYVEGGPFYWMPYPAPPEPGVNAEKSADDQK